MRPIIAILLLLAPAGMTVLRAQSASAAGKQSVLILLQEPQGALGKRLAEAPSSTPVPEEVRTAAQREYTGLVQAQRESFEQRLMAAGATGVVQYPALNMMRADIPQAAFSSLHSDPAVVSVTPLSEDAQVPSTNLGVAVPPAAGIAVGGHGRNLDTFQPPSLMTNIAAVQPAALAGTPVSAFIAPVQTSGLPGAVMPGSVMPGSIPGTPMPGTMMPGMMTPGLPGTGGMFQSILSVTGQMGMQAGTLMPRASGMVALLTGSAQIAQIIVLNRKQGCIITLETAGTQLSEAGGQGVIAVNAPPSCLWQAQSDADWLQITSGGPMMGPGIIKYTATPASAGLLRTGDINIVGLAGAKVRGKTSTAIRQGQ